ncbi:TPA: DUF5011 domain-containing protein [Clostridium perfringens]|nr:DUF5011 domain-containing protein [Clostridium perfringens]
MVDKISESDYIPRTFGTTRKTLKVGSTFNPLENMSAYDQEDCNLTDKIKVIENNVNTSVPGAYKVVYEVTDSQGATSTKTITVTVPNIDPLTNTGDVTILPYIGGLFLTLGSLLKINRKKKIKQKTSNTF